MVKLLWLVIAILMVRIAMLPLRYNSDGSLDLSFDNDGFVITPFDNELDYATDVLIQPDGKIVVGGQSYNACHFSVIEVILKSVSITRQ